MAVKVELLPTESLKQLSQQRCSSWGKIQSVLEQARKINQDPENIFKTCGKNDSRLVSFELPRILN
jgi:hypothetical protein